MLHLYDENTQFDGGSLWHYRCRGFFCNDKKSNPPFFTMTICITSMTYRYVVHPDEQLIGFISVWLLIIGFSIFIVYKTIENVCLCKRISDNWHGDARALLCEYAKSKIPCCAHCCLQQCIQQCAHCDCDERKSVELRRRKIDAAATFAAAAHTYYLRSRNE
jgi:hypothetical protein